VDFITTRNALTEDVISKSAGHATVFRVGEEKDLAARLKDLAGRRFGYTASQIRRAAFPFANNRSVRFPRQKSHYNRHYSVWHCYFYLSVKKMHLLYVEKRKREQYVGRMSGLNAKPVVS
jgi:hypothetical protein